MLGELLWGASALGAVALWTLLCVRRPAAAAVVILGLVVFSPHLLAAAYALGVDEHVVRRLIPVKDVAAAVIVTTLALRRLRVSGVGAVPWPAIALLTAAVLPAVVTGLSEATPNDFALSVRNALVPFVALLTGLLLTRKERIQVVAWGSVLITAGAVLALVEYLTPVRFVRDIVGVGDYWADVKEQPYLLDPRGTGLPGNFFTGSGLRRLSGSFGDPLAAGYTLAAGLIMTVLGRPWRAWPAMALVMGSALLLTITRAAVLLVVLALSPLAVRALVNRSWRTRGVAALVMVGAAGIAMAISPVRNYLGSVLGGRDSSTLGHLDALDAADQHDYSIWSDGFGTAGAAVGRGTENVLITLALQVGLLALVLMLTAAVLLLRISHRRWRETGYLQPFWGLMAGLLVSIVLSEQLLTFNAGWPLMLLVGLAPPPPVADKSREGPRQEALTGG